jgi:chromate transporter
VTQDKTSLTDIAWTFLRLGTLAFGGPAAHIAMMEDDVVRRRQWLTRDQFLDYLGATNLIPGPNSTELAIHIGHARAGWPGLIVAGLSFIVPAALIVAALAWLYVRYGTLPEVTGILYGIKPVVIAIVGNALWRLGRSAMKTTRLMGLAAATTAALAAGADQVLVLIATGAASALVPMITRSKSPPTSLLCVVGAGALAKSVIVGGTSAGSVAAAMTPFGLWTLFFLFAKIGAVLFGSGYVLLAFLRADLVERLGWLSEQQLLDAIAVGQVTPGPVFTTATFVGYVLGGPFGAAVATIGIFLPAFIFVALSGPMIPRLRASPVAAAVLDGVNVASLGLMTIVTWQLGRAALAGPLTVAIGAISLLALAWFRINSAWLIVAGGIFGWITAR